MQKAVLSLLLAVAFNAFSQNSQTYRDIEAHYRNGLEFFDRKNYTSARQEFKTYIEKSKNDLTRNENNLISAEYHLTLAGLYEQTDDAEVEVTRFAVNHADHPKAQTIYIELGEYYFDRGEYSKAIEFLMKGYEKTNSVDLAYKIAQCHYQSNNKSKALDFFNIVKKTVSENAASAAYYAGSIEFEKGQYAEAQADFLRVESMPQFRSDVPNWIAQIYYKQKEYDKLLAYAEPIINNPAGRKIDEVSLLAAEVAYMNGNYAKAAAYYDKAKSFKVIADGESWFRYGYSQFQLKNYAGAIENFKKVAASQSSLGQEAAFYLGIASQKTGNITTALNAFETVSNQNYNPKLKEEAAFNYCKLLLQTGNGAQGVEKVMSFLRQYPNSVYEDEANGMLVEAYLVSNDYATAAAYIERLNKRTPRIDAAYQRVCFNKAVEDYNADRFSSAISYFTKAHSSGQDVYIKNASKFWKAESYIANNQQSNAKNVYEEIASSGTEEFKHKAKYALGYIAYNEKNYPEAIRIFDDFTTNVPRQEPYRLSFDDANLRIADSYLIQKNFGKALEYYNKVIERGANEKDYAIYQKAMIQIFTGKNAEAKTLFDELSRNYPQSRYTDDAWYQAGTLELEKGNYQPAINLFNRVINEKPKSTVVPLALMKRAVAYSNLQNHEAAIKDYKAILDKYPTSDVIDNTLIGIQEEYNAVNRPEDFDAVLNDYKRRNPENGTVGELAFSSAKNMYLTEKYQQAITSFNNYIANYPQTTNAYESRFYIADSYYRLNDLNNALKNYYAVINENKSSFVSRAAYRAGEIELGNKKYNEAIKNYRLVLATSQNKKDLAVAWSSLMESYYHVQKFDSTTFFAKEIISNGNLVNGVQNKAQLYLGKAAFGKNDLVAAETEYRKLLATNDSYGAEALYLIGDIQYRQKKHDESIKTLQEFNKLFSNYTFWYERAFLLIADNYIAKADYFMAKATLNSVIKNADLEETKTAAKEKLNSIQNKN